MAEELVAVERERQARPEHERATAVAASASFTDVQSAFPRGVGLVRAAPPVEPKPSRRQLNDVAVLKLEDHDQSSLRTIHEKIRRNQRAGPESVIGWSQALEGAESGHDDQVGDHDHDRPERGRPASGTLGARAACVR